MGNRFAPQSITLSIYNREATKYGVCWMTPECGSPILEYTAEDDVEFERSVTVRARTDDYDGMTRNTAVIENIVPGQGYLWRVGDESGILSSAEAFRAIPEGEDRLCFLAFADTQDVDYYGKLLTLAWKDAMEHYPDALVTLHAGDIVDDESSQLWSLMCEYNSHLFRSRPMLPATGNHDHWGERDGIFYNYFNIEPPADKADHTVHYSVDVGPVHFTVLSSGNYDYTERRGLREGQVEWAKRDLESTDKPWKVVMIHTPFYSPGQWGAGHPMQSSCLRAQLNSAFAELGVDLVIAGHDHVFAESYPISRDGRALHDTAYVTKRKYGEFYRLAHDPEGPIHILPGCGGNQSRGMYVDMDEETTGYYRDIIEPHGYVTYVAVRVEEDTLTVEFVMNDIESGKRGITRRFGIIKSR